MNKFLHYKKLYCLLCKYSLYYQTVIDQRQEVCHQLFSWTSVGPSKFLIDKMIGSKKFSEYPVSNLRNPSQIFFFFFFQFFLQIRHHKKVYFLLCQFNLQSHYFLIKGQQPFTNCSVGLQLDPRNFPSTKPSVQKAI